MSEPSSKESVKTAMTYICGGKYKMCQFCTQNKRKAVLADAHMVAATTKLNLIFLYIVYYFANLNRVPS